jgi:DNA N-6-adenine-methyltransferase (Dam)
VSGAVQLRDEGSLTASESGDLGRLETTIEHGLETFVEVGEALREIRDRRLYRAQHPTFEDYCRQRWGMSRVHAHRHIKAAEVVALLPVGNRPTSERQARELAPLAGDEAELVATWRELRETHGEKLTAAKMREAVSARLRRDRVIAGLTASGGSSDWYTPARYVEAAREALGAIDLDPASSEAANETVRAERYFSAEDDGLAHDWPGRVWLNPPYGGVGPRFVARLLAQFEAGITTAAVALLNSNTTDTRWFRPCFEHPICFACGRIDFDHPYEKNGQPTHGSLFLYLGPDGDRFAQIFSEFGAVVAPYATSREAR